MRVSRRAFLKYCAGSAAALGLPLSVLGKLEKALAADALPTVIWLNGANCTGCTVSLANLFSNDSPADIADLLINTLDLAFHPNLMAAAGDQAVQKLKDASTGSFILAIDGGIPTAFNGHTCTLWTEDGQDITAKDAVAALAPSAAAILSIGTCASFGGVPSGNPNPTGIISVSELIGRPTINIPGCPTHPDWIVWTVANLLAGVVPQPDSVGRPAQLFNDTVHNRCPRRGREEAETFGRDGFCLEELGCKGPQTLADCPIRQWNNATNWCIGANSICLGCTENGFPDRFSPFYRIESGGGDSEHSGEEERDERDSRGSESHRRDADEGEDLYSDAGPGPLQITRAEWHARRSSLRAEGKGANDTIVSIENGATGTLLGAVSVNSRGIWKFRLNDPDPVPCRIRVVYRDYRSTRAVKRAPANCD
jgi:hydrogenase small subunit